MAALKLTVSVTCSPALRSPLPLVMLVPVAAKGYSLTGSEYPAPTKFVAPNWSRLLSST
jgi:hypothetical protein